jgi:hypothetical protein
VALHRRILAIRKENTVRVTNDIILKAIADYGISEVLKLILPIQAEASVGEFLTASLMSEVLRKCNWIRTLNGEFCRV